MCSVTVVELTGDETEDITVHEVPLAGITDWLAAQERGGKLVDLKVYCGLYFARACEPISRWLYSHVDTPEIICRAQLKGAIPA